MRVAESLTRLGRRRGESSPAGRFGVIDVARGIAVAAMAVYHTGWDLGELRLTIGDVRDLPAWSVFARCIATSFLVLVGAGLVLAHGRGLRVGAFLRRLAVVAGAALVVTVATWLVFPDSYVFFGILHCIAAASVLALPFLRAPVPVTLAVAALVVAAPLLVTSEAFDAPLLAFVGLGSRVPNTNDYVPLFPWTGFVLVGVAAMRIGRPYLDRLPERTAGYPGPLRALALLGRHSLLVYLLHQPLIFGALSGWAAVVGPSAEAEMAPFLRQCARTCGARGSGPDTCRSACTCTIDAIKASGAWPRVVAGRTSPEDRSGIPALARACFDASRFPG